MALNDYTVYIYIYTYITKVICYLQEALVVFFNCGKRFQMALRVLRLPSPALDQH